MAAWVAEPDSATHCGLPLALSLMLRIALRFGEASNVGWKTTPTVQNAPAPRLGGQLLVCRKSAVLAPAMLTLLTEREALLVFVTVTICAALAVPALCGANCKLTGEI